MSLLFFFDLVISSSSGPYYMGISLKRSPFSLNFLELFLGLVFIVERLHISKLASTFLQESNKVN